MTDIVDPRHLSPADRAAKQRAVLGAQHKGLLAWLFASQDRQAGILPQCLIGPTRPQKERER